MPRAARGVLSRNPTLFPLLPQASPALTSETSRVPTAGKLVTPRTPIAANFGALASTGPKSTPSTQRYVVFRPAEGVTPTLIVFNA